MNERYGYIDKNKIEHKKSGPGCFNPALIGLSGVVATLAAYLAFGGISKFGIESIQIQGIEAGDTVYVNTDNARGISCRINPGGALPSPRFTGSEGQREVGHLAPGATVEVVSVNETTGDVEVRPYIAEDFLQPSPELQELYDHGIAEWVDCYVRGNGVTVIGE